VHRGRRSTAGYGLPWRGCRANTEKKWGASLLSQASKLFKCLTSFLAGQRLF